MLNEALPGNQGITTDSVGRTPDWIELYNPTNRPVDLNGWRIAMAGRQHVFERSLVVSPKSHRMLWCDGRASDGADHIAFKLARDGGALLLIAPDGITIADVFSYPAIPADVSIGRYPDGAKTWSFFTEPTPGAVNRSVDGAVRGQCVAPVPDHPTGFYPSAFELSLGCEHDAMVRYTVDGSAPTREHGEDYAGPIAIEASATVRAIAWKEGQLMSPVMTATCIIGPVANGAIALNLDPADLWNDSTGIYTTGLFNNNTRSGKAWERCGVAQWFGDSPRDVSVRISGSGSRGPRKRSFKIAAADDGAFTFGDSTRAEESILRADASPHAWLRNTTLEELVRRFKLNVEVQPSRTATLYLNAAYWGLYRWMPGKDASWLKQRSGAEALDVLEGPAAVALSGSNGHFLGAQDLLVRGAPLDSIEAMIDLRSLIDLACIDLWTGRADHDLNVRLYRPRERGGRWRWVLFDMDLWAPPNENSTQRMNLAAAPETPFVPQLLAHPGSQERLLARITALQATAFAQVGVIADSLHRAHEPELLADFRRWELELDMPHPDSSLAAMRSFAAQRPQHLFEHLAKHTGRKQRTVSIEAPPKEMGELLLDGLAIPPGKHAVRCFSGVQLRLEARAAEGFEFAGWRGVDAELPSATTEFFKVRNARVLFRAVLP